MYRVDVYLRIRRTVMVDGMSIREAARTFGLHRDTVRKMLAYSVPPGCQRQTPPRRPNLEPYTGVIDRILEDDLRRPRKQRHTAKRTFERLRDEYGFDGGYTTVKDYVRENRRQTREMFVPLSHAPGHAQCDFGEALVVIGGVERKAHCFVIDLPHSDGCFVKAGHPKSSQRHRQRRPLIAHPLCPSKMQLRRQNAPKNQTWEISVPEVKSHTDIPNQAVPQGVPGHDHRHDPPIPT